MAVPGLFIYSGGKRGGNYLEWRKAGGELFRVTVTANNQALLLFFFQLFFANARGDPRATKHQT